MKKYVLECGHTVCRLSDHLCAGVGMHYAVHQKKNGKTEQETWKMRKPFLDNLRYLTVLLVIFYHVFYMFNSLGIIRNVTTMGIPQLDVVMYVLYPWFMVLLFLISGISARYSLGCAKRRMDRETLGE